MRRSVATLMEDLQAAKFYYVPSGPGVPLN